MATLPNDNLEWNVMVTLPNINLEGDAWWARRESRGGVSHRGRHNYLPSRLDVLVGLRSGNEVLGAGMQFASKVWDGIYL